MGLPVCARLAGASFTVLGHDIDPARRDELEVSGGRWAEDAAALAREVRVVITVLPGSPELEAVMGPLLPALTSEQAWIDLTSTDPHVGERLRALNTGVQSLEAGMGGGPGQAASGTLELFVGSTDLALEAHRPLLEALGTVHHVGPPGAGHLVKLLVNLLWFGQALATGEALLLARRAGLDLDTVRDALTHSAADSRFARHDLPALLAGDYLSDFGLDRCVEELEAVSAAAAQLRVPFKVSNLVRDLHRDALERYGPVDGELLGVALLEERAGLKLRRPGGG